ncbi:hypothetical protein TNCV_4883131 [Trichonephila clavipes]|nr:hypothetical protein TNCV_4883131 [Trichonephila clavipes]
MGSSVSGIKKIDTAPRGLLNSIMSDLVLVAVMFKINKECIGSSHALRRKHKKLKRREMELSAGSGQYMSSAVQHYGYHREKGRTALRMYHAQFPDHRIFLSGYIVNFVKHVSSTSQNMMLIDEELCTVQRVQAVNPTDYLLQLPMGCVAARLRSSCAEQL